MRGNWFGHHRNPIDPGSSSRAGLDFRHDHRECPLRSRRPDGRLRVRPCCRCCWTAAPIARPSCAQRRHHGPDRERTILSRMVEANLLAPAPRAAYRFYRREPRRDVAHAIEALMALAGTRATPSLLYACLAPRSRPGFCCTCYDHLAGQVGIAVTDALTKAGHIEPKGPRDWKLTDTGEPVPARRIGVDVPGARRAGSRHFATRVPGLEPRAAAHLGGAGARPIADTPSSGRGWAEKLSPQPHCAADRFRPAGDGQTISGAALWARARSRPCSDLDQFHRRSPSYASREVRGSP